MAQDPQEQLDPRYVALILGLAVITDKLLSDLQDKLEKAVSANANANAVKNTAKLDKAVVKALDQFYGLLSSVLITAHEQVVDIRIDQSKKLKDNLVKAGLTEERDRLDRKQHDFRQATPKQMFSRKWTEDDVTLATRIKTLRDGSTKTVRNIIAVESRKGTDPREIAFKIRHYVKPDEGVSQDGPWAIARKRFNRPTSYVPKGMPAGSVQFNAIRIARTETADYYSHTLVEFYKDERYVKGFDWKLSRSHAKRDKCDLLAKGSPYQADKIPRRPHPNCMCYTAPHLMSMKELIMLQNRTSKARRTHGTAQRVAR